MTTTQAAPPAAAGATSPADPGETPAFDDWAIVELFGHIRVAGRGPGGPAGRRRDAARRRAGHPPGYPPQTSFYGPGAVYGLHPVVEEAARAVAAHARPEPVRRWELPAAPAARVAVGADDGYLPEDVATAELAQDLDDLADLDTDPDEDDEDA